MTSLPALGTMGTAAALLERPLQPILDIQDLSISFFTRSREISTLR